MRDFLQWLPRAWEPDCEQRFRFIADGIADAADDIMNFVGHEENDYVFAVSAAVVVKCLNTPATCGDRVEVEGV